MATVFDIRTDPPLKEYQFRIDRFTKGISDFNTLFSALAELFKREMVEQFETEGQAGSGRWTALTPAYKKWKQDNYPKQKIGHLTGALISSMTGGGGYSQTISKTSASFGMSDSSKAQPYGKHFAKLRPVIVATPRRGRNYQKVTHTWLVAEERASMGIGGAGVAGSVRAGGGGVGKITSALEAAL